MTQNTLDPLKNANISNNFQDSERKQTTI